MPILSREKMSIPSRYVFGSSDRSEPRRFWNIWFLFCSRIDVSLQHLEFSGVNLDFPEWIFSCLEYVDASAIASTMRLFVRA